MVKLHRCVVSKLRAALNGTSPAPSPPPGPCSVEPTAAAFASSRTSRAKAFHICFLRFPLLSLYIFTCLPLPPFFCAFHFAIESSQELAPHRLQNPTAWTLQISPAPKKLAPLPPCRLLPSSARCSPKNHSPIPRARYHESHAPVSLSLHSINDDVLNSHFQKSQRIFRIRYFFETIQHSLHLLCARARGTFRRLPSPPSPT